MMYWKPLGAGFAALALAVVALYGCSGGLDEESRAILSTLPREETFFELAARGDVDEIARLIEGQPELVNAQGENGRTMLHYAAANGQSRLVDYLLSQGADPRIVDEDGNSPAEAAMLNTETRIAERLSEAIRTSR